LFIWIMIEKSPNATILVNTNTREITSTLNKNQTYDNILYKIIDIKKILNILNFNLYFLILYIIK
jgi:hypothetical protein